MSREPLDIQYVMERIAPLWNLLSERERKLLAGTMSLQSFRKNEIIYHENESPESLLCLLEGKVKIYRSGVGGRSQLLRLMRPVQYFGYRASLACEPYVTAAAAFEESLICTISMEAVKEVMCGNVGLCRFFISELAMDLGIADRRTVSLTQKHIRGRLAESLLSLQAVYGLDGEGRIDICLSREDLANLSNMTTSNAIRTLSAFSMEGLVDVSGRMIRIIDENRLSKVSRIG